MWEGNIEPSARPTVDDFPLVSRVAVYNGHCPACSEVIVVGEAIVGNNMAGWYHADCEPA
jgi:hypothetical protein